MKFTIAFVLGFTLLGLIKATPVPEVFRDLSSSITV
jgi:hypothetical protein